MSGCAFARRTKRATSGWRSACWICCRRMSARRNATSHGSNVILRRRSPRAIFAGLPGAGASSHSTHWTAPREPTPHRRMMPGRYGARAFRIPSAATATCSSRTTRRASCCRRRMPGIAKPRGRRKTSNSKCGGCARRFVRLPGTTWRARSTRCLKRGRWILRGATGKRARSRLRARARMRPDSMAAWPPSITFTVSWPPRRWAPRSCR